MVEKRTFAGGYEISATTEQWSQLERLVDVISNNDNDLVVNSIVISEISVSNKILRDKFCPIIVCDKEESYEFFDLIQKEAANVAVFERLDYGYIPEGICFWKRT